MKNESNCKKERLHENRCSRSFLWRIDIVSVGAVGVLPCNITVDSAVTDINPGVAVSVVGNIEQVAAGKGCQLRAVLIRQIAQDHAVCRHHTDNMRVIGDVAPIGAGCILPCDIGGCVPGNLYPGATV